MQFKFSQTGRKTDDREKVDASCVYSYFVLSVAKRVYVPVGSALEI